MQSPLDVLPTLPDQDTEAPAGPSKSIFGDPDGQLSHGLSRLSLESPSPSPSVLDRQEPVSEEFGGCTEQPPSRTGMDMLPVELILGITAWIIDYQDFVNLSTVCRRLRLIIKPIFEQHQKSIKVLPICKLWRVQSGQVKSIMHFFSRRRRLFVAGDMGILDALDWAYKNPIPASSVNTLDVDLAPRSGVLFLQVQALSQVHNAGQDPQNAPWTEDQMKKYRQLIESVKEQTHFLYKKDRKHIPRVFEDVVQRDSLQYRLHGPPFVFVPGFLRALQNHIHITRLFLPKTFQNIVKLCLREGNIDLIHPDRNFKRDYIRNVQPLHELVLCNPFYLPHLAALGVTCETTGRGVRWLQFMWWAALSRPALAELCLYAINIPNSQIIRENMARLTSERLDQLSDVESFRVELGQGKLEYMLEFCINFIRHPRKLKVLLLRDASPRNAQSAKIQTQSDFPFLTRLGDTLRAKYRDTLTHLVIESDPLNDATLKDTSYFKERLLSSRGRTMTAQKFDVGALGTLEPFSKLTHIALQVHHLISPGHTQFEKMACLSRAVGLSSSSVRQLCEPASHLDVNWLHFEMILPFTPSELLPKCLGVLGIYYGAAMDPSSSEALSHPHVRRYQASVFLFIMRIARGKQNSYASLNRIVLDNKLWPLHNDIDCALQHDALEKTKFETSFVCEENGIKLAFAETGNLGDVVLKTVKYDGWGFE